MGRQMKKFRKTTAKVIEHEPFSVDVTMSENDGDVPVATMPDDDVTEQVEAKTSNPKKKKEQQPEKEEEKVAEDPTPDVDPIPEEKVVEDDVADESSLSVDDDIADTTVESTSSTKKSPKMSSRGLSRSGKR